MSFFEIAMWYNNVCIYSYICLQFYNSIGWSKISIIIIFTTFFVICMISCWESTMDLDSRVIQFLHHFSLPLSFWSWGWHVIVHILRTNLVGIKTHGSWLWCRHACSPIKLSRWLINLSIFCWGKNKICLSSYFDFYDLNGRSQLKKSET